MEDMPLGLSISTVLCFLKDIRVDAMLNPLKKEKN